MNVRESGLRLCGGLRSPDCPEASHCDLFPSYRVSHLSNCISWLSPNPLTLCRVFNLREGLGIWETPLSPPGPGWLNLRLLCVSSFCSPSRDLKSQQWACWEVRNLHIGPRATVLFYRFIHRACNSDWCNSQEEWKMSSPKDKCCASGHWGTSGIKPFPILLQPLLFFVEMFPADLKDIGNPWHGFEHNLDILFIAW